MAYQTQEWENLPDKSSPFTGERMEHMEEGIANAVDLDSEQTITGSKTFEEPIVVNGEPTEENHVARLGDLNKAIDYTSQVTAVSGTTLNKGIFLKIGRIVYIHAYLSTTSSNREWTRRLKIPEELYPYGMDQNDGIPIYSSGSVGFWAYASDRGIEGNFSSDNAVIVASYIAKN